jgi:prepilin-type N-terminal cleavage/methylation domain-containing protein
MHPQKYRRCKMAFVTEIADLRSAELSIGREASMNFWTNYPKAPRQRCYSAFTMAEVLVAVLVLAVIATAFYGALSSAFSVVQSTREDLRATQILMRKVEGIRLCTWSQLTNFTFSEPYDPLTTGGGSVGPTYSGTVTVGQATNVPNTVSYTNDILLVTITVNWTNYRGSVVMPRSKQMQTQVARNGMQNYVWGATAP